MLLPELAAYTTAQIPTLVLDQHLFYGLIPPNAAPVSPDTDTDSVVCLFETGSWQKSEPDLGTGNMRLVYPTVQVISRGVPNNYDAPRLAIQGIVTAWTKILNQVLTNPSGGSTRYLAAEARQDGQFLQRDELFRVYFVTNFNITRAYSAT